MEIHRLEKIPEGYEGSEISEFHEWDIKQLIQNSIDEVWYWYATRPYEGSGAMIMRKGDKWYHKNCGHCSCYGPMGMGISDDVLVLEEAFDSLDAMKERMSNDYYKTDFEPLFQMITNPGQGDDL